MLSASSALPLLRSRARAWLAGTCLSALTVIGALAGAAAGPGLGLFLLSGVSGCQQPESLPPLPPDQMLVNVSVEGVTSNIRSLVVRLSLNGKADPTDYTVSSPLDRFSLRLPNVPESRGSLQIEVIGLAADRCRVASVKKSRTLEGSETQVELTLSLTQLAAKACYLTVSPAGTGTITSVPPGISCSTSTPETCSAGFDSGTKVTLTAAPADTLRTYTHWPAPCKGGDSAPTCEVSIFEETRLNVSFDPRQCTPGGACWYDPLPVGYPVQAVWAGSSKDAWAVGAAGTILHYDGTSWTQVPSTVTFSLGAVWGSGPSDVWAAGSSATLLHYDGSKWSQVTAPSGYSFYALSGTSANDVWLAGPGAILHYDGSKWVSGAANLSLSQYFYDVWAAGENDVWLVGDSGAQHFDGKSWQRQTISTAFSPQMHVFGYGPKDVYISTGRYTSGGELQHFDGTTWSTVTPDSGVSLASLTNLSAMGSDGKSGVFLMGVTGKVLRYQGASCKQNCWSSSDLPGLPLMSMMGIAAAGEEDVWAVGDNGVVLH